MPPSQIVTRGPTTNTLRAIEDVLRKAAAPMSRYEIRKALGERVGAPLLDEALDYMADHEMVYDEGPGGKVLWIRASSETMKRLRGK
ncbi:MAG: hypothetical protein HYT80_09245 [Euryarchaeota archaeon]|nr:hypothetical protein [Euryarchaeota archaeon]